MVSEVMIPVMDETTETVTLSSWLKGEGETVKKGEVLCEIETDKATVEIEAPDDGIVRRVLIEKGARIPPRTIVALISDADEPLPPIDPFYRTARANPALAAPAAPKIVTATAMPELKSDKVSASPRARKLAEENGIDLAMVTGTGPDGRILEEDVKLVIARRS